MFALSTFILRNQEYRNFLLRNIPDHSRELTPQQKRALLVDLVSVIMLGLVELYNRNQTPTSGVNTTPSRFPLYTLISIVAINSVLLLLRKCLSVRQRRANILKALSPQIMNLPSLRDGIFFPQDDLGPNSLLSLPSFSMTNNATNLQLPPGLKLPPIDWDEEPESLDCEPEHPYEERTSQALGRESSNISQKKFIRVFLENAPVAFRKEMLNLAESATYRCVNLIYPELAFPNVRALEFEAKRYREKYSIQFEIISFENLSNFFQEASKTSSGFVGVTVLFSKYGKLHVTPIVFFFSPSKVECAILDTTVDYFWIRNLLLKKRVKEESIFYPTEPRVVDVYSCRTGALTVLRDTLLSLRYHSPIDLKTALKQGKCEDNRIIYLPPEWNGTEQVSNPCLKAHHLVIRRFYSLKGKKEPVTIIEYRKKHTEQVRLRCDIWRNGYSALKLFNLTKPDNVVINGSQFTTHVEFFVEMAVNTYLLTKSLRNKQRYLAAHAEKIPQ